MISLRPPRPTIYVQRRWFRARGWHFTSRSRCAARLMRLLEWTPEGCTWTEAARMFGVSPGGVMNAYCRLYERPDSVACRARQHDAARQAIEYRRVNRCTWNEAALRYSVSVSTCKWLDLMMRKAVARVAGGDYGDSAVRDGGED